MLWMEVDYMDGQFILCQVYPVGILHLAFDTLEELMEYTGVYQKPSTN